VAVDLNIRTSEAIVFQREYWEKDLLKVKVCINVDQPPARIG